MKAGTTANRWVSHYNSAGTELLRVGGLSNADGFYWTATDQRLDSNGFYRNGSTGIQSTTSLFGLPTNNYFQFQARGASDASAQAGLVRIQNAGSQNSVILLRLEGRSTSNANLLECASTVGGSTAAYINAVGTIGVPKVVGTSGTPTAAAGAGLGTTPTGPTIVGNDIGFEATFTTGSAVPTGTLFTVTFAAAYVTTAPVAVFVSSGTNALPAGINVSTTLTTVVLTSTIALTAATQYKVMVQLVGR